MYYTLWIRPAQALQVNSNTSHSVCGLAQARRNFRKSNAPIGKEMLVVYNRSGAVWKMRQKGRYFED